MQRTLKGLVAAVLVGVFASCGDDDVETRLDTDAEAGVGAVLQRPTAGTEGFDEARRPGSGDGTGAGMGSPNEDILILGTGGDGGG